MSRPGELTIIIVPDTTPTDSVRARRP